MDCGGPQVLRTGSQSAKLLCNRRNLSAAEPATSPQVLNLRIILCNRAQFALFTMNMILNHKRNKCLITITSSSYQRTKMQYNMTFNLSSVMINYYVSQADFCLKYFDLHCRCLSYIRTGEPVYDAVRCSIILPLVFTTL